MLTIKDLAVSKELDSRAMAAVVGGNKTEITLNGVDNSGNIVIGDGNQALNNSAIVSGSFNGSFNRGHGHGRPYPCWF
jgi:hypothetical protein